MFNSERRARKPSLLACLGALKYPALDDHARELLFLTAAWAA